MRLLLHRGSFTIGIAVVLILLAIVFLVRFLNSDNVARVTTTVDRGAIEKLVSVSAVVEADNTAELGFPVAGIIDEILVDEGSIVETGDVLARLRSSGLQADLASARAALASAIADRTELISGPTATDRAVTAAEVSSAERALTQTIKAEDEKVKNALRALRSNALAAQSIDSNENATAPTVTGTYTCEQDGEYRLKLYGSQAASGYSYEYTGLEVGTASAFTDQSGPLGECGLRLQFSPNITYSNTEWIIKIPNTDASTYTTLQNAYELALEQRDKAITAAESALTLAEAQAAATNATPRAEALDRADAIVAQARARIENLLAALADRTLTAPFAGEITDVAALPGEAVTTAPFITLLADNAFSLTARIPEIDITDIAINQPVRLIFDARPTEVITGFISFISPLAIEIDGVAYFEATISFTEAPDWIRSGLNADVDIITATVADATRVPKRFVERGASTATVYLLQNEQVQPKSVEVGFEGNDGYIEIIGIAPGTTVVAP